LKTLTGNVLFQEKKIEDDLSIDHVLPWSYLFSDDIWNLVYLKKNLNSSKSNKIPNESMIKKLELRNIRLLDKMKKSGINDKRVIELETSIKKDYVREFWYGCKG
jgi:CRISPR/Cas system Type II protein with McrA/HNH and RuvC-like nuclease domain